MKEKPDEVKDVEDDWLDRLDEIVEGMETTAPDDDELLQIAGRLTVALAPYRELDAPARAHRQRLGMQLRTQLAHPASLKKWLFRPLMVAAAILIFVVLGPGIVFEFTPVGIQNNHLNKNVQGWEMTDLPSTNTYNIAAPINLHGLLLLIPTHIASNGYLIAMNRSVYGSGNVMRAYLVYEQDAIIYETPSPPLPPAVYTNSGYQLVHIGAIPGFLSHTRDGQNRLEWYQAGLLCDLVGKQSPEELVAMVEALEAVRY